MTTFLLVRHARTAAVGRAFTGRTPGVTLDAVGRGESAALARRLAGSGAAAVYASPQARALETAAAVAAALEVEVRTVPAFAELDLGGWTGCEFAVLDGQPQWMRFNAFRGGTRPPGGELQLEAQARAVGAIERLRERHDGETVVVVSHADVLKAVLGHYLGVPTDLQHRLELAPASLSVLEVHAWGARVERINDAGAPCPASQRP